ncbi:MAG: hypothetical protein NXH75_15990 [Halobacteriovoraceae bacterium]|nr:hypothetical protein [Halobacteriovoraceae bacterium]
MNRFAMALLKILVLLFPSSLAFAGEKDLEIDLDIDPNNDGDNFEAVSPYEMFFQNLKKKSFFIVKKTPTVTGISIEDLINEGIINFQRSGSVSASQPVTITLLERREVQPRLGTDGSTESTTPVTITLHHSYRRYSNGMPFTLTAIDNSSRTVSVEAIDREEVIKLLISKGALKSEEVVSGKDLLDLLQENSYGIILGDDEVLFTIDE